MPEDTLKTMSGSNLLGKNADETVLVATAFANKDGETLFLRNDKYTAYFPGVDLGSHVCQKR